MQTRSPHTHSAVICTAGDHPICPVNTAHLTRLSPQLHSRRQGFCKRPCTERAGHASGIRYVVEEQAAVLTCAPAGQPAPARRRREPDVEAGLQVRVRDRFGWDQRRERVRVHATVCSQCEQEPCCMCGACTQGHEPTCTSTTMEYRGICRRHTYRRRRGGLFFYAFAGTVCLWLAKVPHPEHTMHRDEHPATIGNSCSPID